MKAAVYVRKSNEQQTADEREQSTARQADACREFIAKQPGWTVAQVYDEGSGVSGTIAHEERPALARLLADAKKKPRPFDALVVWRDDRLSREGAGAITLLDRLAKLGIRVFHANTGREATVKGTGLIVASAEAYGSNAFAEKIHEDTKAARARLFRSVEAWCSGAPPYGYVGKRVLTGGTKRGRPEGHSVLVIDPEQAATVKRIFEAVANGESVRGLARQLTVEGVPAPRGRSGWRLWTTSLICRNRTYIGETSLNGETRRSESIRIVSDQLFAKAQRILDKTASRYAAHRDEHGRLQGRPEGSGKVTTYAFADLLVCGVCGSKLWFVKDPRSGVVRARCKKSIGPVGACRNAFGAPYTKIKEAVVALIRKVKPEQLRALYEAEAAKRSANATSVETEVAAKRREIAALDAKIEKLLDAIENGQPASDRLKARRAEKDAAEAVLAELEAKQAEVDTAAFDWPKWVADMAKDSPEGLRFILAAGAVEGTEGLHGRALLKVLFPKPITVTPVMEGGKPVDWDIKADLNTDPLFEGSSVYGNSATSKLIMREAL
jgi:site-specific DNA recombinase